MGALRALTAKTKSNQSQGQEVTLLKALHSYREIVRAQKNVSKDHPNTLPKPCSVVTDPQVYCEVICDPDSNQVLFQ